MVEKQFLKATIVSASMWIAIAPILMVYVACDKGKQETPVAEKPEPEPKTLHQFNVQGMRFGDVPKPEFFAGKTKGDYEHEASYYPLFETIKIDNLELDILYDILNGEFHGIHWMYKPDDFEDIAKVFIAKYGKPMDIETETKTNAMGAKFENVRISWETDSGFLVLRKYGSTATQGSGVITSKELIEFFRLKEIEKQNKLFNKL